MSENGKDKIVRLIKEAAATRRAATLQGQTTVISVSGNGNITAGGDVYVCHPPPSTRIETLQIIRKVVWRGHTSKE